MNWYAVNKDYINYLKEFDSLVPNIDYGNRMKCFLGVVFESSNGIKYFAPLSSYKPKFQTLRNNIDFYKIIDSKTNRIFGAINLNNMIPVPDNQIEEVSLENLSKFREFNSERDKLSYWKLLNKELSLINEKSILNNAEKLFYFTSKNPDTFLSKHCCSFEYLEKKCLDYEKLFISSNNMPSIEDVEDKSYDKDDIMEKSIDLGRTR